jgi:hypothetical protein
MIIRTGRSYEPSVAPSYIFKRGPRDLIEEAATASALLIKGRMPIIPSKINGVDNFQEMVRRIIPIGGPA